MCKTKISPITINNIIFLPLNRAGGPGAHTKGILNCSLLMCFIFYPTDAQHTPPISLPCAAVRMDGNFWQAQFSPFFTLRYLCPKQMEWQQGGGRDAERMAATHDTVFPSGLTCTVW